MKDKGAITVRWAAHDDNGDDLSYSLYLRGDGEHVWRLLKDDLTEKAYSFDATLIPGRRLSDQGGGERCALAHAGRCADRREGERPVRGGHDAAGGDGIDGSRRDDNRARSANCAKPVHVTFEAADAASPIAHAEYSLDAGPWKFIAPVGELSDSKQRAVRFSACRRRLDGKPGEHLLTVRVYDRYDNVGVAKTVFTTTAK